MSRKGRVCFVLYPALILHTCKQLPCRLLTACCVDKTPYVETWEILKGVGGVCACVRACTCVCRGGGKGR